MKVLVGVLRGVLFAALAGAIDGFFAFLLLNHLVHIGYLNWWAIAAVVIETVSTATYYLQAKLK